MNDEPNQNDQPIAASSEGLDPTDLPAPEKLKQAKINMRPSRIAALDLAVREGGFSSRGAWIETMLERDIDTPIDAVAAHIGMIHAMMFALFEPDGLFTIPDDKADELISAFREIRDLMLERDPD